MPQSSGNNLHLNKLLSKIFQETLRVNDQIDPFDLLSLIDLSVKLFGVSEKLTVSITTQLPTTNNETSIESENNVNDFEFENSCCAATVNDGLKLFNKISSLFSSTDIKTPLAHCVCRLLKELADYPIYCFQNKKLDQDSKEGLYLFSLKNFSLQFSLI